jgi:hypothetical protein
MLEPAHAARLCSHSEAGSRRGRAALLMLPCGSIVYLAGLALWQRRTGFGLRATGLILATAALAIPSTLTLLLPVAALLALTLRAAPAGRAPH